VRRRFEEKGFSLTQKDIHFFILKSVFLVCMFLLPIFLTIYFILAHPSQFPLLSQYEIQLLIAHIWLWWCCILLIQGLNLIGFQFFFDSLRKYFFRPEKPYHLAVLRWLTFVYLAKVCIDQYYDYNHLLTLSKVPLPGWKTLINYWPVSPLIYLIACVAGALNCLFLAIGFRNRWTISLHFLVTVYIFSTPNLFGKLWHNHFPMWFSWLLALSPCADALSIKKWKADESRLLQPEYSFWKKLIWLQFGVIYFWVGFYKVWDAGFNWALSDSMVNQFRLEWFQAYKTLPPFRIDLYPNFLEMAGLVAILLELSFPIWLLNLKSRWISAIGGLCMHLFNLVFLYIGFINILVVFYLSFIDFNRFFKARKGDTFFPKLYTKISIWIGIGIVSLNFLFGLLDINSYPFSTFPKYSMLIESEVYSIQYKVLDEEYKEIKPYEIAKEQGWSWEDYGKLEYNLIKDFREGKAIDQELLQYWKIWQAGVPKLHTSAEVRFFIGKQSLDPEKWDKIVIVDSITTFRFEEGQVP
jgi:hypothetical protein